jgi:hypothetical protein
MYCPNCGLQNQAGSKFCKQCGTNLAAVSDALSGKLKQPESSKELVKLIKEFQSGRRKAVQGAALFGGGIVIMILLTIARMPMRTSFWIISWMFLWGIIEFAMGISKWVASSGELKALGYWGEQPVLHNSDQKRPSAQLKVVTAGEDYSTGPLSQPGSVTEDTTRRLEEKTRQDAIRE